MLKPGLLRLITNLRPRVSQLGVKYFGTGKKVSRVEWVEQRGGGYNIRFDLSPQIIIFMRFVKHCSTLADFTRVQRFFNESHCHFCSILLRLCAAEKLLQTGSHRMRTDFRVSTVCASYMQASNEPLEYISISITG